MATVETVEPRSEDTAAKPVYDGFISYSHAADGKLAPKLQTSLQRFAKPWWKTRAVRIFRDQTSLSANPHLWTSITQALDQSNWLILLVSPDAAGSKWINQEIDYWTQHKDPDRILPVVTDGTFHWDGTDVTGTAVPEALRGVFGEEPRWVDMRFAHNPDQLTLKHPGFSEAVADIASAVRQVPKDELESEEVRQHRRTLRLAWTAVLALIALSVVAVVFALQANHQRNTAENNADLAQANAAEAEANALQADTQRNIAQQNAEAEATARQQAEQNAAEADRQRAIAETNAREARARELSLASVIELETDPERSILLALEAVAYASEETLEQPITALRSALAANRVTLRVPGEGFVDLSPDGSRMVTGSGTDAVIWDAQTGAQIQALPSPDGRKATEAAFSPDGDIVAVGYTKDGTDGPLAILWDIDTGQMVASLDGPELIGPNRLSFSGDGSLLAGGGNAEGGVVWDIPTGTELYRIDGWSPSLSPDGSLLALVPSESPATMLVLDAKTGLELDAFETPGLNPGTITFSPDGLHLAALSQNPTGLIIWDVETRRQIPSPTLIGQPTVMAWSPDGTKIAISGNEGTPVIYDLASGDEVLTLLGSDGTVWSLAWDPSGEKLAGASLGDTLMWDVSASGLAEVATLATPYLDVLPLFTDSGELVAVSYLLSGEASSIARLDPESGDLVLEITDQVGAWPTQPMLFPEAGLVGTIDADGSAAILEIDTFEYVADLPQDTHALAVSPDREWIVLNPLAYGGAVLARIGAWDDTVPLHNGGLGYAYFDPDGELLTLYDAEVGNGWLVEVSTGALLAEFPFPEIAGRFSPDGSLLAVPTLQGSLRLLDTGALLDGARPDQAVVWERDAHDGPIPRVRFDPDGTFIVTHGLGDLQIRVWDAETGGLVADLGGNGWPFLNPSFSPDGKNVIAAGPNGTIWFYTLDADELVEIARSRLTRTFTEGECADNRIDPCPTFEEIVLGG